MTVQDQTGSSYPNGQNASNHLYAPTMRAPQQGWSANLAQAPAPQAPFAPQPQAPYAQQSYAPQGYPAQAAPQNYAPQNYAPQNYAQQSYPQNHAQPQGYAPQSYSQPYAQPAAPQSGASWAAKNKAIIIIVAVLVGMWYMSRNHGNGNTTVTNNPTQPQQQQQQTQQQPAQADPRAIGGVITTFLDAVQEGDADRATNTWDASKRDKVRPNIENMCQQVRSVKQAGGTVAISNRNIDLNMTGADTCTATVTYALTTPQGTNNVREAYEMVQHNGEWFILDAR